jgi:FtsH-binding integral membrane protein
MDIVSVLFFCAAALLGITLLIYVMRNKNTPKALVFSHGFFATVGLLLLIIFALLQNTNLLGVAILFIAAAAGGFILSVRDLLGKPIPKWLAIGHGVLALLGVVLLLVIGF